MPVQHFHWKIEMVRNVIESGKFKHTVDDDSGRVADSFSVYMLEGGQQKGNSKNENGEECNGGERIQNQKHLKNTMTPSIDYFAINAGRKHLVVHPWATE